MVARDTLLELSLRPPHLGLELLSPFLELGDPCPEGLQIGLGLGLWSILKFEDPNILANG